MITLRRGSVGFFVCCRKEVMLCCSEQLGWKIKPRANIEELIICQSLICCHVSVITFIITDIHFAESSTTAAVISPG